MKYMKKKILAVMIFVLCAISLCGCASVSYEVALFTDGSVEQSMNIQVDKNCFTECGKTMAEIDTMIRNTANSVFSQLNQNFFNSTSDEAVRNYVAENVTTNISLTLETKKVSILFKTIQAYHYFYNQTGEEEDDENKSVEEHPYYSLETTVNQSVFYDLGNNTIAKAWLDSFSAEYGITFSDCDYTFVYTTPYESKTDANLSNYNTDGTYSYLWNYTAGNLTGDNATTGGLYHFYDYKIKSPIWYFTAIGVSALAGIVMLVFVIIKEKQKKSVKVTISKEKKE